MSLTYGELPTEEQFKNAYHLAAEGSEHDGFTFHNDSRVGNGCLTRAELWNELQAACEEFLGGDDQAGEWCSCVLSVLDIEWV